jgi:hypothetical protein
MSGTLSCATSRAASETASGASTRTRDAPHSTDRAGDATVGCQQGVAKMDHADDDRTSTVHSDITRHLQGCEATDVAAVWHCYRGDKKQLAAQWARRLAAEVERGRHEAYRATAAKRKKRRKEWQAVLRDVPPEQPECCVCHEEQATDPLWLPCGHAGCTPCLREWTLKHNGTCPVCRCTVKVLVTNAARGRGKRTLSEATRATAANGPDTTGDYQVALDLDSAHDEMTTTSGELLHPGDADADADERAEEYITRHEALNDAWLRRERAKRIEHDRQQRRAEEIAREEDAAREAVWRELAERGRAHTDGEGGVLREFLRAAIVVEDHTASGRLRDRLPRNFHVNWEATRGERGELPGEWASLVRVLRSGGAAAEMCMRSRLDDHWETVVRQRRCRHRQA